MKYAELRRLGHGHAQFLQVVNNDGVRRVLDVTTHPAEWAGRTEMWRGRDERDEYFVPCAIRHSNDCTRNVVAVSFPRQCAGSPHGCSSVSAYRYGETRVYVDDALRDEPFFGDTLPNPAACTERAAAEGTPPRHGKGRVARQGVQPPAGRASGEDDGRDR